MIIVTASKLRNHLFEYLDKVSEGETIVIQRNKKEVARLTGLKKHDWRKEMQSRAKILVSDDEIMKPLEDVWEDYE